LPEIASCRKNRGEFENAGGVILRLGDDFKMLLFRKRQGVGAIQDAIASIGVKESPPGFGPRRPSAAMSRNIFPPLPIPLLFFEIRRRIGFRFRLRRVRFGNHDQPPGRDLYFLQLRDCLVEIDIIRPPIRKILRA
jgi:hypothetical protein